VSIVFLSVEDVRMIHARQVADAGSAAGIRDERLLESAVASPRAAVTGQYLHRDLAEMAAAYLFHLAKNHPFVDGNKRVAAEAAVMFLEANGLQFIADADEFADLVLNVARGVTDKLAIAAFFRDQTRTGLG
jgi:death on curing protein